MRRECVFVMRTDDDAGVRRCAAEICACDSLSKKKKKKKKKAKLLMIFYHNVRRFWQPLLEPMSLVCQMINNRILNHGVHHQISIY